MGNRMAARAPVSVLLLVALACLAFPAAAHGGGSVFSHKRQLLGVFDDLKSMLNKLASGFEKDIHKVEHALAEIPSDLEVELTKLKTFIDKIDNQEDLKTAVKAIGDFILKFQPWLVKVNSKVFGPELGPILEKLELAAVEQVPIVGTVFKVVVEGVDIYDDIKGMRDCIKDKDYLCAGKDLLSLFTAVSGVMEADFSNMKDVIQGLAKAESALGAGIDIAETISEDVPKFEAMFKKLHDPSVQDIIDAVSDLAGICIDFVTLAKNIDPDVVAKWKAVAARFKSEIAVAEDVRYVWIAGTDVYPMLKNARMCWDDKDYVCVGKDVGQIVTAVESVVEDHFQSINKVAQVLAKVDDAVNVAVDVEEVYKDLDQVFDLLQSDPPTADDVEQAASKLSDALELLGEGVSTVSSDTGGSVSPFAKKLASDLKVVSDDVGKARQVLVSGIDVFSDLQAAKKCWTSRDYPCLAEEVQKMITAVSAAASEFDSMKLFCAALAQVSSAVGLSEDVVATYGDLVAAAQALASKPLSAGGVEQALTDLATAMQSMSSEVTKLNQLVGSRMDKVAQEIEEHLAKAVVVDGDVSTVVQSGADIAEHLKKAGECWESRDFICLGNTVAAIVDDVSTAIAVLPDVKKLEGIVGEADKDVKDGVAFLTTFKLFSRGLKDIYSGSEDGIKNGLGELADALGQLQGEVQDLDDDTHQKYTTVIQKLKSDVTVSKNWMGHVEKVMIGSFDAKDDLDAAAKCEKDGDWSCVVSNLKKMADAINSMRPDVVTIDADSGEMLRSISVQR